MKRRLTSYLPYVAVFLAVIITYSNHFENGFHFDDLHTIVNNVYIRSLANIPRMFVDNTTASSLPSNQSYRPIVTASTAVDYWLGRVFTGNGLDPFFFHLSMFTLFLLQGLLMYFVYLKVFDISFRHEWNRAIALTATAWYLLHPGNAETINYLLARSDSISTFFVVLAFFLYLYSPLAKKYYLYLIAVTLACLAKPTGAIFGTLLLFYIMLFEEHIYLKELFSGRARRPFWSAGRKAAVPFLFCAGMLTFTHLMEIKSWSPGGTSRFHYLITQPFVVLHYFTTFFAPVSLSADTDWRLLGSIVDIRFLVGMAFILALFGVAVAASKKPRYYPISFGILWFFAALVPTSTVIPLAEVLNDHRLFYPYVGLTMSVTWALALLVIRLKGSFADSHNFERLTVAVIAVALAGYAYGTFQRNKVWRTEESLWHDVTIKSPRNGRGLMNYGVALLNKSDYVGAEEYFNRALELLPRYPYLYINMGVVKAATGHPVEAGMNFRRAIALGPNYPDGYFFYARFLEEKHRDREAITNLQEALRLAPAHLDARHLLMKIYAEQEDWQQLKELARQTLNLEPSDELAASYLTAAEEAMGATGISTPEGAQRPASTP